MFLMTAQITDNWSTNSNFWFRVYCLSRVLKNTVFRFYIFMWRIYRNWIVINKTKNVSYALQSTLWLDQHLEGLWPNINVNSGMTFRLVWYFNTVVFRINSEPSRRNYSRSYKRRKFFWMGSINNVDIKIKEIYFLMKWTILGDQRVHVLKVVSFLPN